MAGTEPEEGTTPHYQQRQEGQQTTPVAEPLADEARILLDPAQVAVRNLPGDLTLLVYPVPTMGSAVVRLSLEAGSVYDPAGKAGLAQLTAQLLTRGTETYTPEELAAKPMRWACPSRSTAVVKRRSAT